LKRESCREVFEPIRLDVAWTQKLFTSPPAMAQLRSQAIAIHEILLLETPGMG
jgi:hypothetical protein